jgi:hypothetical protein
MMLIAAGAGAALSAYLIPGLAWWPGRITVLISCVLVALAFQWMHDAMERQSSIIAKGAERLAFSVMILNSLVIVGWFLVLGGEYLINPPPPTACTRFCD